MIFTVLGLLAVCAAMVVSVAGLALVQRLVSPELRKQHNDVAGFIYAVIGIVYAVLLALVVVAVWGDYEATRETTDREANELAEIFWLAHQFPEPEQRQIQELARSYAQVVLKEEWPLMAEGRSSPRAWALLDEMRGTLGGFEPRTAAQQALYQEGLDRIHDLADARRTRLVEANEGIPAILWVVLGVGGMVAVGFTYLFGLENTWVHRLMVAALAGLIALVLLTIGALDYPFSGDARIGPGAFELILDRFETSELSDLR
jgi:uncharacterized membrane protein